MNIEDLANIFSAYLRPEAAVEEAHLDSASPTDVGAEPHGITITW